MEPIVEKLLIDLLDFCNTYQSTVYIVLKYDEGNDKFRLYHTNLYTYDQSYRSFNVLRSQLKLYYDISFVTTSEFYLKTIDDYGTIWTNCRP